MIVDPFSFFLDIEFFLEEYLELLFVIANASNRPLSGCLDYFLGFLLVARSDFVIAFYLVFV